MLFGFGTFLLVVVASSEGGDNAAAAAAVLGGVLVLAGACCASPLAVDRMSAVAARVGRSWRFAGRSLGRTRPRSAAVVTAIAVTAAAAAAGSALALSAAASSPDQRYLPEDVAVIRQPVAWPRSTGRPRMVDFEASPDRPVDADLQQQVDAIVPSAQWIPLRVATWDPAPYPEARDRPRAEAGGFALHPGTELFVADPMVLDHYELGATDRAALESTGVLLLDPWSFDDAAEVPTDAITLVTEDGEVTLSVTPREWVAEQLERPIEPIEFDGTRGFGTFLITEEAARRAGLDIVTRGAVIRADSSLTESQKSELSDVVYDNGSLSDYYRDVPRSDPDSEWLLDHEWAQRRPPPAAVQAAIVAGALLLTLLVVAIALSLAATESRDERDVLVAVGARPSTLRRMAGVKAVVITLTGVLLAIPTGLIPVAAVRRTLDEPFVVPWLAIIGLVAVLPLVAGFVAWGVSSVAQRARPAHMSTLAFE
jgi:putative ABC transport system permease protein